MKPRKTARAFTAAAAVAAAVALLAAGAARWWVPALAAGARKRPPDRGLVYVATADMRYLVPVSVDFPAGDRLTAASRLVVEWTGDGVLRSPFPVGSRLRSAASEGSTAVVRVAVPPASGGERAGRAALDALALTLTGLDGIMRVTVEGYGDDGAVVTTPRPAFVNHDGSPPVGSSMRLVCWFGYGGRYLVPYTRFVPRTLEPIRTALEHLVAGPPVGAGLDPTVPRGTRPLGVAVSGGVCAIDLSEEMSEVTTAGGTAERMAVESVLLTATEFAGVSSVDIRIRGKKPQTLGGYDVGGAPLGRPVINPAPARPN